jgi:hypothetical protein
MAHVRAAQAAIAPQDSPERLRAAGVDIGVVVELHGQVRLLDVFDPDGNRIQLAQVLDE